MPMNLFMREERKMKLEVLCGIMFLATGCGEAPMKVPTKEQQQQRSDEAPKGDSRCSELSSDFNLIRSGRRLGLYDCTAVNRHIQRANSFRAKYGLSGNMTCEIVLIGTNTLEKRKTIYTHLDALKDSETWTVEAKEAHLALGCS
jgi:hypothetical protein